MTLYLDELVFLLFNYIVIRIHAKRFDNNIPIRSGFHFWWGLATVVVGLVLVYVSHWNWWFAGALVALRAWFYNPGLNWTRRHPQMPFFYLSKDDKHNSALDKLVYGPYKVLWFIALGGWIFLQYKIYEG